jgi:hypothetical protein
MANNFKIKAAELVEVFVPSGNTRQQIYFPDLPNIRSKQIEGIEVYSALEQSTSLSGSPIQASADIHECIVTLYYTGGEYTVLPLESIRRVINKTNSTFFGDIPALNGQVIDWTKCYITLTTNIANFANKSFLFNVYYIL